VWTWLRQAIESGRPGVHSFAEWTADIVASERTVDRVAVRIFRIPADSPNIPRLRWRSYVPECLLKPVFPCSALSLQVSNVVSVCSEADLCVHDTSAVPLAKT
jgi:hypothetical protein